MNPVRILLADDHTVMRNGLRLLLERQPDLRGRRSRRRPRGGRPHRAGSPDVVVMDIAMPNLNGIEAARQIVSHPARTAIVMLSMHSDEAT